MERITYPTRSSFKRRSIAVLAGGIVKLPYCGRTGEVGLARLSESAQVKEGCCSVRDCGETRAVKASFYSVCVWIGMGSESRKQDQDGERGC